MGGWHDRAGTNALRVHTHPRRRGTRRCTASRGNNGAWCGRIHSSSSTARRPNVVHRAHSSAGWPAGVGTARCWCPSPANQNGRRAPIHSAKRARAGTMGHHKVLLLTVIATQGRGTLPGRPQDAKRHEHGVCAHRTHESAASPNTWVIRKKKMVFRFKFGIHNRAPHVSCVDVSRRPLTAAAPPTRAVCRAPHPCVWRLALRTCGCSDDVFTQMGEGERRGVRCMGGGVLRGRDTCVAAHICAPQTGTRRRCHTVALRPHAGCRTRGRGLRPHHVRS